MKRSCLLFGEVPLRFVAVITLITFGTACMIWKVVPLKKLEANPARPQTVVRVHPVGAGEPVVLRIQSIDYPNVTGIPEGEVPAWASPSGRPEPPRAEEPVSASMPPAKRPPPQTVTIDLRKADKVEVRSLSAWRTLGVSALTALAAVGVFYVILLLTKTSCPFVYLDDGDGLRFVGEAYSGATSRSTQRDDLLALCSLAGRARLVLSNEADETQFTDLIEMAVVDHAPGDRAVATDDARFLLLGAGSPPLSATDLAGRDVLEMIRESDGHVWETNLEEVSQRSVPPSREGMVVTFPTPADDGTWALELTAGNTPWLDVVFGRFFALLGDRLDRYLDQSDRPESRASALAWREREGVDLSVEVEEGGAWRRVAVAPTVGPASIRTFAVPIPVHRGRSPSVRLSGGVGFWLVDQVALAPVRSFDPVVERFAPASAREADGGDVRDKLAATDGEYQILHDRGESLELVFELPPIPPGLERESFLHTSGYYRVHTPPQAELSAGTLHRLRDEPGSLSRFSVDLYRGYAESARRVAVAP